VNRKIFRGVMLLLASVCVLSAAATAQQPSPARARRGGGGLDNLSLPSTTARVASASTGASAWQTFAPEKAGFSVSMPGLPEESTREVRAGGQSAAVQVRTYRLAAGGLKYEIGRSGQLPKQPMSHPDYMEMEKIYAGVAQVVAIALAGENQESKFRLVSEQTISLDGYEGREYEFAAEGERAVVRLFLVERALYGFSVTGANREMTAESVSRFLDSFALTQ